MKPLRDGFFFSLCRGESSGNCISEMPEILFPTSFCTTTLGSISAAASPPSHVVAQVVVALIVVVPFLLDHLEELN